ncbi:MAG: metal-dependent phosphohydrolase [Porticoccaceae bacterium]|nr:metal-dependent phosphohydrolase [Porticoccaceae bacterium]
MFSFFKRKNRIKRVGGGLASYGRERRFLERKKIKIPTHKLRVGMFVSELDRPWLETPFTVQGFHIQDESDIDEIRKHSEYVYIDVFESSVGGVRNLHDGLGISAQEIHKFPDSDSWFKERRTYERVTKLTFGLLDRIAMDSGESSKAVRSIVDSCVDSVISNPYTLTLISQMERVSISLESHAISCCALATSFGRFLGMDDRELHDLALGALLHDVGMLKLPSEIVNHEGSFSRQQHQEVTSHARFGSSILTSNDYYWPAVDVAFSHHERVDGNGYPRRLKGSSIPYNARIVSIVDVYDRLTSSDSYRKPVLSPTNAMGEIYEQKGKQFDAQLVEKFIRFMGVYPLGTPIQLNTGEIAIVVEKNPFYMVLPKVLVVADSDGNRIEPRVVDLFDEKGRSDGEKIQIAKTLAMNDENAKLLKEATISTY